MKKSNTKRKECKVYTWGDTVYVWDPAYERMLLKQAREEAKRKRYEKWEPVLLTIAWSGLILVALVLLAGLSHALGFYKL